MKSILKFLPVALGVLTMASCSNEDFFGSDAQKNGKELIPTVENLVNADGGTTRNAISGDGTYSISWQEGDVFRVYDEAVQAYDIFSKKAAGITIDGDADVEAHKYALYPGNKVSYAGWDKTNGVSAVMKIDDTWPYGGAKKATFTSGEKTVYATSLPMWGPVTDETSEDLKTPLNYLTSVLDVCVYQKAANKIRVVAFKDKASEVLTNDLTGKLANEAGKETPLSGYFFAQLKEEGQLVKDMTQPNEMKNAYGYKLEINVNAAGDEAHVLIPIIPATYKYLSVQYSADDGATWTKLNGYENTVFARKQIRKTGLVIGNAPITAVVSSLKDLNDKLKTIADNAEYRNRTVNITATGDIKTSQALAELTIPTMTTDQIVNFNFPIDDTDNPLTIAGGTAGTTMTINLNQGISGNTAVTINTAGNLVLTGSINSSRGDQYKKLTIEGGNVTLGSSADFNSFSTNMDVVAKRNLVIDAVEGEIANVELSATNNPNLQIKTGKVTKVASASTGTITIDGGEVATIEQAADGDVTINAAKVTTLEAKADGLSFTTTVTKGAEITDLKLAKSTGAVSITDAAVTTLETAATIIDVISTDTDATVGTLKLGATWSNVTLNEYSAVHKKGLAKIENLQTTDANTQQTVNLNSYDKTAVGNVTFAKSNDIVNANSYINAGKAADIKTDYIGTAGEIYTAAQLAGVTTGKNYKLMADIYANSNEWAPVNLNGTFDGKGKTIYDINVKVSGGLFGTISGGEVKNLNIYGIAVAKKQAGDMGALAGAATGTVAVSGVKVTNATIGTATVADINNKNINYGGLFGTTNGTITLTDNQVVNSTINAYGNAGGFIGNVKGGSVTIKTSKDDTSLQSDITFQQPKATDAANAGTFGNFIGTISGNGASITIGGTAEGKGGDIAKFFNITDPLGVNAANSIDTSAPTGLRYKTRTSGSKKFVGMCKPIASQALNYEIGYCSATTLGTIYLYNTIYDNLGNKYEITLDNINVFE